MLDTVFFLKNVAVEKYADKNTVLQETRVSQRDTLARKIGGLLRSYKRKMNHTKV